MTEKEAQEILKDGANDLRLMAEEGINLPTLTELISTLEDLVELLRVSAEDWVINILSP